MEEQDSSKCVVQVSYIQPEYEELECRFPAYVNPDYKGQRFDPIDRCKGVSKEDREVVFEYLLMGCDASTDEVLVAMDHNGLRPALYEELLCFAEKYPDEQRKYQIIALGSEVCVIDERRVAYIWGNSFGRHISLDCVDFGFRGHSRFLAVRK